MSLMIVRRATFRAIRLHALVGLLVMVGVLALAGPALASSSVASAWGKGDYGDLGDGFEYNSPVPVEVEGLSGVSNVAAGGYDSLALLEGGTVDAWGNNGFGQLGNGTTTESDVPVQVNGLSEVSAIAAGWGSNLALLKSGKVMAWGWNSSGQLGIGTTANSDVPVEIKGLSGVMAVASSYDQSLALLSNGKVMAWGGDQLGQLGDGSTGEGSDVPVAVSDLSEVTAIAAGEYYSLALLKNGTVMAWGDDEQGELGDGGGAGEHSDLPVAVCAVGETSPCSNDLQHVSAITADGSVALLENGTVVAWGDGDLGDGSGTGSKVPVKVSALSEVTAISGSMALLKDGTVMAWGTNIEGELGDPSAGRESLVPVAVSGLSGVTAISAGEGGHELAVGAPPVPFPQVAKVEPNLGAGDGGTTVTITGFGFTGVKAVKFGSTNATSFDVESESKITAVSPAGTGTVDVTVETAAGTSPAGGQDQFRYAPTVNGVQPDAGFPAGGTTVTITGTDFNEVSAVKFGSTNAASYEVLSEDKIKAVSPPGTNETTVNVTVETRGGTSPTESDHFTYTDVPGISSVTPNHGPPSGGTTVTITGSSFTGATEVHFGSTEAKSFKVESETEITAVSPAFTGGDASMPVFVTSPGGTNRYECGEEQVGFIYEPIITSVEPNSGPAAGGTEVTIKGADFKGTVWGKEPLCTLAQNVVSWVDFGSTQAKSVNVVSESEITAVAPAGTGTANVTVRGVVGPSPITPGDQFSYGTPVIEGESVSNITEHDATLEAQINPIVDETEYEFWLECAAGCASGSPERVGAGHIPAGDSTHSVSVDLSDLQPGASYTYWVLATSSDGKTESPHETFKALPPPPVAIGKGVPEAAAPLTIAITPITTSTLAGTAGGTLAFSGLSLPAVQHGDSLVAQLTIGLSGSRVEVDVTAPAAQASSARKKGKPKPVVLARLVRKGVAAGRLKLTVPLNAKGRRELGRHKRLTVTVTIVVTPPTGKPQTATHTVTLESR